MRKRDVSGSDIYIEVEKLIDAGEYAGVLLFYDGTTGLPDGFTQGTCFYYIAMGTGRGYIIFTHYSAVCFGNFYTPTDKKEVVWVKIA